MSRILQQNLLRMPGIPETKKAADTLLQTTDQKFLEGKWVDAARTTLFYNAMTRLVKDLTEGNIDGTWGNDSTNHYTLDAMGRVTEQLIEKFYLTTGWQPTTRLKSTLNAGGDPTETIIQTYWDSAWDNSTRVAYLYDATGNETELLEQTWSVGKWINSSRETSVYVPSTRTLTKTIQAWSADAWHDELRILYKYGSDGYLDSLFQDGRQDSTWDPQFRVAYTISTGQLIDITVQIFDNAAFENHQYMKVAYDNKKRRTAFLTQNWSNSAWVNYEQTVYTYGTVVPVGVAPGKSEAWSGKSLRQVHVGTPGVGFTLDMPADADLLAGIYDMRGELVDRPEFRKALSGSALLLWNGVNGSGAQAGPGRYVLKLGSAGKSVSKAFVLTR